LVGLFTHGSRLFVWIDGEVFEANEELTVDYSKSGGLIELTLEHGQENRKVKYVNSRKPVSTPYYSEDEVDADLGLWIHNVLSSHERTSDLVEQWRQGIP